MNYKVVIDAYRGGTDNGVTGNGITEKNFSLDISNYINKRLNDLGIPTSMVRTTDETIPIDERVNRIQSAYGIDNNVIVISNQLNNTDSGAEITYALRNSNALAERIAKSIESTGQNVTKYYQRRSESDTSKDYDQIIRDTANNQTLIIKYGNVNNTKDSNILKNNKEELGEAVVQAITNYIGATYTPLEGTNYYTVQSGDTLYKIANRFNTTVQSIKNLNNLTSDNLSIGQLIKIPTESTESTNDYVSYTVQSGDTLYKLANRFNVTVNQIKTLNNLTSDILQIGQVLNIPTTNNPNQTIYTVKKGDSLYQIAKNYNTTVQSIINANNLTSTLLSIGQRLIIPTSSNQTIYTVKKGDSLYKIANNYNTTVQSIKNKNNLTSDILQIGQQLIIP